MLKFRIPATVHAALSDALKSEYKKVDGAEEYQLDTDVASPEDVTGLKSALAHERNQRATATARVTSLEGENATLLASRGSITEVETAWKKRLEDEKKLLRDEHGKTKKQLQVVLVDDQALRIASEISTSPDLIIPHIKSRLRMEEVDGQMVTRVLDAEGKASTLSPNELAKEFIDNKVFAPIIKASSASGSGASGNKGGSGAGGGAKKFSELSEPEKVALHKKDPVAYRQLRDAGKSS
jgi:hypothetical protein